MFISVIPPCIFLIFCLSNLLEPLVISFTFSYLLLFLLYDTSCGSPAGVLKLVFFLLSRAVAASSLVSKYLRPINSSGMTVFLTSKLGLPNSTLNFALSGIFEFLTLSILVTSRILLNLGSVLLDSSKNVKSFKAIGFIIFWFLPVVKILLIVDLPMSRL